jgi:hypothetical protein
MESFLRSTFGELVPQSDSARIMVRDALQMATIAASGGKIPKSYDSIVFDRKRRASGGAVHHEIYDITPNGNRVLLCIRKTEGNKYGVSTVSKNYVVLARHGLGIRVLEANKSVAAKAAKAAKSMGDAILVALGKLKCPVASNQVRNGYKILVRSGDHYVSAWDGSVWDIGKQRVEAATDDHSGGYYYYATLDQCLSAAAANDVFGDARNHRRLAIVEVKATGKHFVHRAAFGEKLCATKITPLREIAYTL